MYKDNKRLVTDEMFIKISLENNLSLQEFLLLLYFDNSFDSIFDLSLISKTIGMKDEDIISTYASLLKKKLITVKAQKNSNGKMMEKISLDPLYNSIKNNIKKEEEKSTEQDIFSKFESTFGRTLSSMDSEIINAWLEKGFSEELILEALKEANYNGALTLRYIDKILFEWNKKGIKSVNDLEKVKKETKPVSFETCVMEFDWLNEK